MLPFALLESLQLAELAVKIRLVHLNMVKASPSHLPSFAYPFQMLSMVSLPKGFWERKKRRQESHPGHTGVGAHSGGPAALPSCVSLFIHRSADSRNESHTRTCVGEKRTRKWNKESGRAGVNEVRREEEVIKKEILEKARDGGAGVVETARGIS